MRMMMSLITIRTATLLTLGGNVLRDEDDARATNHGLETYEHRQKRRRSQRVTALALAPVIRLRARAPATFLK